jgi:predicted dehydrogenase
MLRVGLVGYGFMGHMHAQCYAATGETVVTAVADVDPAKRAEAEEKLNAHVFGSIQEMLAVADLDLVDICTPTFLHEEHVIAAAHAGKNIMCEKPMSLTLESCDRMIEAANDAGIAIMFGQVIRFWPEYVAIKELVDSGKYGKVLRLSAQRRGSFPTAWEHWFEDASRSGGGVLDLHIHDEDYIVYLIGFPKIIDAVGTVGRGNGVDGVQVIGRGYKDGASSYAEAAIDLAPGFPFNMSLLVHCEKATMNYDLSASPSLMVYPVEGEPFTPDLPKPSIGVSTETSGNISNLGGYYNEIKYFIDCIKTGKKPEIVTPESARDAVRLCLAAARSVEIGQPVEI